MHTPQRRTSAGLGAGKQSAAPPLQPAEPIFAAAARRVARRCDPNEGGNGPAPTPAAPPREGAPVGAAFPEQLAAGRRAASAQRWPSAHGEPTENRMLPTVALSQKGHVDVARGSHPAGPQVLALVRMRRLSRPHLAPRRSRPTF